jgi:hypothetical protein
MTITDRAQLIEWLERQRHRVTVEPAGEQGSLFGPADPMVILWNRRRTDHVLTTAALYEAVRQEPSQDAFGFNYDDNQEPQQELIQ